METAQQLCERLRERGFVITPQRRTIFEVLERATHHPSAEQIHEEVRQRLPEVSLATIYKTLKELVEQREILELTFDRGISRFDPKTHDHSHLRCDRCGHLEDVEEAVQCALPAQHVTQFRVERTEVVFHGMCATCQQAEQPSA